MACKGNLLSQALSTVVRTLLNGTWEPTNLTGRNGSVVERRREWYNCTSGGSKIQQKSENDQMDTIANKRQHNESVMIGMIEETKASERKIQK